MRNANVDNVACAHGVKSKTHILSPSFFSLHTRKQHFSTIGNGADKRRGKTTRRRSFDAPTLQTRLGGCCG